MAGTLGAAVWRERSSELAGLVVQLSTSISSEAEPETQNCALRALRAVALSLVSGLASGGLSIVEEEEYQDSLAAALTFLSAHQSSCKQVLPSSLPLVSPALSMQQYLWTSERSTLVQH